MSDMPKVIWITHEDTGASLSGSFRAFRASSLDHGSEYARYIRADAPELVALVEAVKYVLDGYGLNAPDYRDINGEHDEPDWIVEALRPAIAQWEALQ